MGKTCRRNRKNRRGGWSLKFWKKKPKYKKQQITNQERREYSAALETAAHANTKPTIISRDAQQGQKHQAQKLEERKARRTKELARTQGLRNLRKQMIEKSGRAGQNGGFRKRKTRRRRKQRRKRRRRRKTRKRGSGTPPPPKRRAGKPPPRTPTGEFPSVPKPRKRRSSKYYSAREPPQTEQARRTVSKIIGNASNKATRKLVTRRHGLRREKAKAQVVPLDEIFDNTGRAPGTWSAETSGFSQLKPAVKGTRHKGSKLTRQDSHAFGNNYARRHGKTSKRGRKRAAVKGAVKGAVRALGAPLSYLARAVAPSREDKRKRAQRDLKEGRKDWGELLAEKRDSDKFL